MHTETNQARLVAAYDAISRGDFQPLLDMMVPEVRWIVLGDTLFSGLTIGIPAMIERQQKFLAYMNGPATTDVVQVTDLETHVFIVVEVRGTSVTGTPFFERVGTLVQFQEGQIIEIEEFSDTQQLALLAEAAPYSTSEPTPASTLPPD